MKQKLIENNYFFFRNLITWAAVSGLYLFCAFVINSNSVRSLGNLAIADTAFYGILATRKSLQHRSKKMMKFCGIAFSYTLLGCLSVWSGYSSYESFKTGRNVNGYGLVCCGCFSILLTIVMRKISTKKLDPETTGLKIISGIICVFCGITEEILDRTASVDSIFNSFLSAFFVFISARKVLTSLQKLLNNKADLENSLSKLYEKYRLSVWVREIGYVVEENGLVRLHGSIDVGNRKTGLDFIRDLKELGYKPTFMINNLSLN